MIKINCILCIIVVFNKQKYTYGSDKNKKMWIYNNDKNKKNTNTHVNILKNTDTHKFTMN